MQLAKILLSLPLLATLSYSGAPRYDRWEIIGPGGGGGIFLPTISPHDTNLLLASCDMTGAYISHDGGRSWRMFNLGGTIQFFLFDPVNPDVIYAKTFGPPPEMEKDRPPAKPALFRSTDRGKGWRQVYADSPGGILTALAVDPANSKVLYAAIWKDGTSELHLSTDWGRRWGKIAALPDGCNQIYVDPKSPRNDRTIYVIGTRSVTVCERGKWRTGESIRGVRTTRGRPELQSRMFSAGFLDRGGQLVVYAIAGGELFVSDNAGAAWHRSLLPDFAVQIPAIATSLYHPEVAYLSFNNGRQGSDRSFGVLKTKDLGNHWEAVWKDSTRSAPNVFDSWLGERFGPGWGGNPFQMGVAPTDPNVCYTGDSGRLMGTRDEGKTWQAYYSEKLPDGSYRSTGLDVTTCYGVHFDPFDLKRMFISYTDIGLFRSENGGKSWISASIGVPDPWVNTTYWIAFDPTVRGRVWGAMSRAHDLPRPKMFSINGPLNFIGGVCRSDDGGKTWRGFNQGMPPTAVTHIIVDPDSPANARVLYAAGFGRGVFKSTDGGENWALKSQGIEGKEPLAWRLIRDPHGVVYLVVARRSNDGSIGGEGDGAIYRSTDGAEHWTKIRLPEDVNGPHGMAVDPLNPRRLYLAAWGRRPKDRTLGGGIFLSTDGGTTWKQVLDRDQHVYDITVDPIDPKIVYACGFEASAWRSTDRGESWKRIRGFNFKWGHRVIPDPLDRGKIYITTYGGSVWHGPAEGDPNALEDVVSPRAGSQK
jgi:photosystem II stability/assembly factor-like uncharacterized protein